MEKIKKVKKANKCKVCGYKIRGFNHMNGQHHKSKENNQK